MTSFEELGLSEALVEALSAEGFERPTAFQVGAIPVLRRGNHLVGEASSGAGVLLAYGTPLLDRIAAGEDQAALVIVPSPQDAEECARALAPIASPLDVSVAALDAHWAGAFDAQIVFATAESALDSVRTARLKLDRFTNLVIVNARELIASGLDGEVIQLAEHMGKGGPSAIIGRPAGPGIDQMAERLLERPMSVPPRPTSGASGTALPTVRTTGKTILYRIIAGDRREALIGRLAEVRRAGSRRAVLLFRTEDDVADVGDFVGLHGYPTGEVGDDEAGHWILTDAPENLNIIREAGEPLTIIAFETPGDEGVLQAAAQDGHEWLVLVRMAELPHLKAIARAAGVELRAAGAGPSRSLDQQARQAAEQLRARLEQGNLLSYGRLLEDFMSDYDPLEVAAAALALHSEASVPQNPDATGPAPQRAPPTPAVESWAKLFLSIGSRDGIRPGDLLGAVTGEAGIQGTQVGRIDVQDAHSVVEVDGGVANRVIRALNGTSIRGRAIRVDLDRSHRRSSGRKDGAGSRPGRDSSRGPSGGPDRGKPRR